MNIYINPARRHSRPRMSRRRHTLLLLAFTVIATAICMAEHLALLAIIAVVAAGAYYLGHLHSRRRARPGQAQLRQDSPVAPLPAAAAAVPAVTLPQADYPWDEPVTRQQPSSRPAGPDRDKLLATPMSGARSLWGLS